MSYSRAIKLGVDLDTGNIYDADELFKENKYAFDIRTEFHENKILLHCCECFQRLDVSSSKCNRLHFKHQKKSNPCPLKDDNLSIVEMEISKRIFKAKESDRHIELKNKIAEKIIKIEGVNPDTIAIDDKFIVIDNEKRKPDVYCEYYDKKLVFEVQLSQLSLRYILSRYNFYKKNGMYLVWILDNFDIHGQGQLERDIKYLTEFQNFFKLDEEAKGFKLICDYKFPFLTNDNMLLSKWLRKSVSINQIKFSPKYFQIYYFNFGQAFEDKEKQQRRQEIEIEKAERERLERERVEDAKWNVQKIISEIRKKKKNNVPTYGETIRKIENLNFFEQGVLNEELGLKGKLIEDSPILNQWFRKAQNNHYDFLRFVLRCKEIELTISGTNEEGVTSLIELYKNKNLTFSKLLLAIELFKRGYQLTNSDKDFFRKFTNDEIENEKLLLKFQYFDKVVDKDLIPEIDNRYLNVLFMIESAKTKRIVGTKLNNWVAFANNAIQYYSENWEYIELAFRKFSLFDEIVKSDKKGSFQKKLNNFYNNYPQQDFEIDEIIRELYPEIYEE